MAMAKKQICTVAETETLQRTGPSSEVFLHLFEGAAGGGGGAINMPKLLSAL